MFAASAAWWRDAGVDACFDDAPRRWLPETPPGANGQAGVGSQGPQAPLAQLAPPLAVTPPTLDLPTDLESFSAWWRNAPELDDGRLSGRVAPRGVAGASLMIVSCMPESGDSEHLLSGPEGRLLAGFVAASGLSHDRVYWASALPCHAPGADWSPERNRAAADALIRHIALVKPDRLLVLGFNILPLLGHASPQGPAVSSEFNHESVTVPMLAVRRIPATASQPRWKASLWRAWLDWAA